MNAGTVGPYPVGIELAPGFRVCACPFPGQTYMLHFDGLHYLPGPLMTNARAWLLYLELSLEPVGMDSSIPLKGRSHAWTEHRLVIKPFFRGQGLGRLLSEYVGDEHLLRGEAFYSTTRNERIGRARNASRRWKPTRHNGEQRPATWRSKSRPGTENITRWSHQYVGDAR